MQLDVLLIDDDPDIVDMIEIWCTDTPLAVRSVSTGEEGLAAMSARVPDVVLLDMYMPGISGLELLDHIAELPVPPPVVFFSASSDVDLVVEAMRRGAQDYVVKPPRRDDLLDKLQSASRRRPSQVLRSHEFHGMVGASPVMEKLYRELERVSGTSITVLLAGESGTGKELAARAVHTLSPRVDAVFLPVNCAAISPGLEDAELFGHVKGSFTGAMRDRAGWFEQASGGTLFLDEVGDLPLGAQAKLLRTLQEGTVQRVGSSQTIAVDVRVVAATHKDLRAEVEAGRFRQDLWFRLATFEIAIPPLRARIGDVPLLAETYLQRARVSLGRPGLRFARGLRERLAEFAWPGNVRELASAVQRAAVLADGDELTESLFRLDAPRVGGGASRRSGSHAAVAPSAPSLDAYEEAAIKQALLACDGNLSRVSRQLGISRTTLYRKLERYGLR
jgi:DNA-binding NtrC family response regulator